MPFATTTKKKMRKHFIRNPGNWNNWAMIFREIVKEEAWSAAVHGVTESETN